MGVDMQKRVEAAGISLQKMVNKDSTPELGDVSMQCTLEVDFSLSMSPFYSGGQVQDTIERALALIMTGLDPDHIVPVTFFDHQVYDTIEVGENSYAGVAQQFVDTHRMGGTNYTGPIQRALDLAEEDTSGYGFLHLFLTDGEPGDKRSAEQLLVSARQTKSFFQVIQFGNDRTATAYLDHLNNELTGPGLDNLGVCRYPDPRSVTDEQFFDDIVSEVFPKWLPAARAAGYCK